MQTIFITGASSGIGKMTAQYFAEKNWNVIATMRKIDKNSELNKWENIFLMELDVENENQVSETIHFATDKYKKIDVLVNNAGIGLYGIFELATAEQMKKVFDVNVFGLINVTRAFLPHFRQMHSGIIVNVSSMAGRFGFPGMALYSASKFAVEGFTEAICYELEGLNIQVKLIEPGTVNTDFYHKLQELRVADGDYRDLNKTFNSNLDELKENYEDITTVEAVAKTIYQAITEHSNKIRYLVGADAISLVKMQKKQSEIDFNKLVKKMYCRNESYYHGM